MKKYILAVLVDNKPGVLTHVSGLISRRALNIESISKSFSASPKTSTFSFKTLQISTIFSKVSLLTKVT